MSDDKDDGDNIIEFSIPTRTEEEDELSAADVADTISSLMQSDSWIMFGSNDDGETIALCSSHDIIEQLGIIESCKYVLLKQAEEDNEE